MSLDLLLNWWNLIFVVPFFLALTYLALYVFTGLTFGDGDADASVDGDADGDMHVQVEAHVVDADGDHDMDHGTDHDTDHDSNGGAYHGAASPVAASALAVAQHMESHASVDSGASLLQSLLSLLGVGKIPLSLVLMILLLLWGSVGFMINQILVAIFGPAFFIGFISIPVTAVISVSLTGLLARLIGRILPTVETYARKRNDLVGLAGEAIYDIDSSFGLVSVHDTNGDFFQVPCRTAAGKPPIKKGARVVLFDYDTEKGFFHVAPFAV